MEIPIGAVKAQIAIPSHTDPVQLQTLYLKLSGGIFKIKARSRIFSVIEKPMHRIYLHPNINCLRFEALGF